MKAPFSLRTSGRNGREVFNFLERGNEGSEDSDTAADEGVEGSDTAAFWSLEGRVVGCWSLCCWEGHGDKGLGGGMAKESALFRVCLLLQQFSYFKFL